MLTIAARVGGKPLLIPTEDVSCLFVADNSDALRRSYRFPEEPRGLARSLSSKREMYTLCKKFDIATPEASFPDSRTEVIEFAKTATFPLMIKPVDNGEFQDLPGAGKSIASNPSEVLDVYNRLSRNGAHPELVLQEYIPGGAESVWMFNGYFDQRSKCLFGVTGKKLRQYPPYVGQTSLGVCERNQSVAETTQRFMHAIGYRGILDIGYRYDSRDGIYKLLDVNPRIGSAFRLFVAENGLDVARALYLDMTGQPVPAADATQNRKWFVENYDLAASLKYYRDGGLSLREWISSLRDIEEYAWLAVDDPVPFGAMWVASAAYVLREARSRSRTRRNSRRNGAPRPRGQWI
jgi:predicted ATP-grasp superfamily ATP-dependent carboligase